MCSLFGPSGGPEIGVACWNQHYQTVLLLWLLVSFESELCDDTEVSAMAEELQDGKSAAEISKALRLEKKDFPSRVSGSHKMTTWTVTRHVWSSVP